MIIGLMDKNIKTSFTSSLQIDNILTTLFIGVFPDIKMGVFNDYW